MTQLEITQGFPDDFPLQCWNRGRQSSPTDWASGDTLAAAVWGGQSQSTVFTTTPTWYTAGGTQTGYGQAQVTFSVTAAQSALLEANGVYNVLIRRIPAAGGDPQAVWEGTLLCRPSSGTGTDAIATYCTLQDCLDAPGNAPWIRLVQDYDVNQEGFYRQRLQARQWMDWAILNCYRGASVGNFEFHSTMAFAFGGGVGWRRGLGPSPSMITWLADDLLILRPQIIEACAYKTIAQIGLAQIGINNQQAALGAYYRDMAERLMTAITAEIDLNADGVGEIFVSLGSTNTLRT